MSVTVATVESYLDRVKWRYRRLSSEWIWTGTEIREPFQSSRTLEMRLHITTHWVRIQCYLSKGVPVSSRDAVLEYLCTLNANVPQFKYLIHGQRVVLQVDIPRSHCAEGYFMSVFRALLRHARDNMSNISLLMANPSVARLYQGIRASAGLGGDESLAEADSGFRLEITAHNTIPTTT